MCPALLLLLVVVAVVVLVVLLLLDPHTLHPPPNPCPFLTKMPWQLSLRVTHQELHMQRSCTSLRHHASGGCCTVSAGPP